MCKCRATGNTLLKVSVIDSQYTYVYVSNQWLSGCSCPGHTYTLKHLLAAHNAPKQALFFKELRPTCVCVRHVLNTIPRYERYVCNRPEFVAGMFTRKGPDTDRTQCKSHYTPISGSHRKISGTPFHKRHVGHPIRYRRTVFG